MPTIEEAKERRKNDEKAFGGLSILLFVERTRTKTNKNVQKYIVIENEAASVEAAAAAVV